MIIKIIIFLLSAVCGLALFVFFRRMPVEWLLDYNDQKPTASLYRKQQIPFTPYAILLSVSCMLISWLLMVRIEQPLLAIAIFLTCLPLLMIILADFRTRIIPDQFVLALVPCAIFLWIANQHGWTDLLFRVLAGLGGGLALALIGWIGSRILHQEAMGMGDVKLIAASGLVVGVRGIILVGVLSFLLAAPVAIWLLIQRRIGKNASVSLAFGPFIAGSVMIVLFFRESLLDVWKWWLESALIL